MNNSTLASGGGGVIAGAIVIVLAYILSFWQITLPADVATALTAILYFIGHRYLDGKLNQPPTSSSTKPGA